MIIESPSQLAETLAQANEEPLRFEVPATKRQYLLVNADRYDVVLRSSPPAQKSWTEVKNARRCELIRRKFVEGIAADEERELSELQEAVSAYRQQAVPLPYDVVEELRATVEASRSSVTASMTF